MILPCFWLWVALFRCFFWPNSVQGDRNRAIRVQQEPLRLYEEAQFQPLESVGGFLKKSWHLYVMFATVTWLRMNYDTSWTYERLTFNKASKLVLWTQSGFPERDAGQVLLTIGDVFDFLVRNPVITSHWWQGSKVKGWNRGSTASPEHPVDLFEIIPICWSTSTKTWKIIP